MTFETSLFAALSTLVPADRVYPDVARPGIVIKPYITYQQVGGTGINFMDPSVPSKKNARVQISIWGDGRPQVAALAAQVEDVLRIVPELQTTVLGAPVAMYEFDTKLYGSRQDFSVWS